MVLDIQNVDPVSLCLETPAGWQSPIMGIEDSARREGLRESPSLLVEVSQFLFSFLAHFEGGSGFEIMSGSSDYKESAYDAGDLDSIPGLGRSPGEGNGNPLQYSCLENSLDRRTWQATVHGVIKSDMAE